MAVKAVPEGWHTVTPRLFVSEPAKLVEFLKHAFGATGSYRDDGPTDVRIGDSIVMVSSTDFRQQILLRREPAVSVARGPWAIPDECIPDSCSMARKNVNGTCGSQCLVAGGEGIRTGGLIRLKV